MKPSFRVVVGAALAALVACNVNAPIGEPTGGAGTGAPGGTTGAAGTGVAGTTADTGVAGTGGANTGVAGTGFTGVAGSGPVVPIVGAAGTTGTTCSSYGSATRPTGTCVMGAFKRNGVCQCQSATPDVCGDTCVDVLTNDDNCGCCGVKCGPTSTCNDGKCGPPPTLAFAAPAGCGSLDIAAAGGGTLIYADREHGTVGVLAAGGAPQIIATGEKSPARVAKVGNAIFWSTPRTIRQSVAGGAPTTVVESVTDLHGFTVSPDGHTVYVSAGTNVVRARADGSMNFAVVGVEARGGVPTALALDGNRLMYPTDVNGDVDVITMYDGKYATCDVPTADGEFLGIDCARVARSQGSLFMEKIVALPGQVIWADGTVLKTSSTLGGIPANDLISTTLDNPVSGFAVSANMIYFSESSADGAPSGLIYKAALTRNGIGVRIARGQRGPRSVDADVKAVYWSTADCTIMATRP